jgi:hypothetical protein
VVPPKDKNNAGCPLTKLGIKCSLQLIFTAIN